MDVKILIILVKDTQKKYTVFGLLLSSPRYYFFTLIKPLSFMKNLKSFALIAMFSGAFFFNTHAQIDVTLNPIGILWANVSVNGDFVVADNFSVEGSLGLGSGKLAEQEWNNFNFTTLGKYYLNPEDGADNFYLDAFLRYVNRNYEATNDFGSATTNRFGIGFGLGYKVVADNGFVFDIGVGGGRALYSNTDYEIDGDDFGSGWNKIMLNGKLGIGYRFGR